MSFASSSSSSSLPISSSSSSAPPPPLFPASSSSSSASMSSSMSSAPPPPRLPGDSTIYSDRCDRIIEQIKHVVSAPPSPTAPSSAFLDFDRAVNTLNTELNENLRKLGPVSSSPTEPRLQVNIGIKIIKDNIIGALQQYYGGLPGETQVYEKPAWILLRNKYPWLNAMFLDLDPVDPRKNILTDMGDQRDAYASYLLNTLIEIILNGSLIAPCQFHTGQGFTTRIAEEHRAVVDPTTGHPYDVMRWNTSLEPALWLHTQAHSSASYPKKSGTSIALYRTLSNKSTSIETRRGNTPIIKRTALLFLNLNHLDYDDADNSTWIANANMINQLATLVRYRLGNWNIDRRNIDPLLDDNLTRGPGGAYVTAKIGRWMMEHEHQMSINTSLSTAYTSDPGDPDEGRRVSTYTDDKLLHYPLVDFLHIFSDMINQCINEPLFGEIYTALQEILTPDEINEIFPSGFNIDIIGTVASFLLTKVSGFSPETIINGDAFRLYHAIFRPTTGVVAHHTGDVHAPYHYRSQSGGSKKRNFVEDEGLSDHESLMVMKYLNHVRNYYTVKSTEIITLLDNLFTTRYPRLTDIPSCMPIRIISLPPQDPLLICLNKSRLRKIGRHIKKAKSKRKKHKGGYKLTSNKSKKRTRRHSRKRYY